MSRFLLFTCSGFLLLATSFAATAPSRVGSWELEGRAVFAVAADPQGEALHFVYADGKRLHHSHSADGVT